MTTVIKMENIRKIYDNGFLANDNINFSLNSGEIHAIAGENGAGKSTLMKLLYGVETPTSGKIYVRDKEVKINSPSESMKLGIGMVFQHFMLVDELTVLENIFLGMEKAKFNILQKEEMRTTLIELCDKFNMHVDFDTKCGDLSVSQKQKVEILKVLAKNATVLIFDEPTAVLTAPESDELFTQLKLLREAGHTIVLITHKLNEIKALCDRVTVLRKGKYVGTYDVKDVTIDEISRLMVGFDVTLTPTKKEHVTQDEVLLELKDVSFLDGGDAAKKVSFNIKLGEIVCLTGVEGSGQEKVVAAVMGNNHKFEGDVIFNGIKINNRSIAERRKLGISYIPADRMGEGANLKTSILENISAHNISKAPVKHLGFFNTRKLYKNSRVLQADYRIATTDMKEPINLLSGGNIQKVVTARELETNPILLVAEHPTRGVDVGTMELIFQKMNDLRELGNSILLVSTDWNEMIALADRIIIFYDGEITAIIDDPHTIDEYELGYYMLGVKKMEGLS
ncbi:MAG: Galactose/methyl galactoside import ATP-binding protein MglA [Tenericutes bacterium ADurb.Bin239]|nr:MAG: Galactose/methyl galactoside import ATP-binding protein MglA [Tenericutes bacterium ADurb.Bin239]